jgi:hypothetical protein
VATEQVGFGDLLSVDIHRKSGELIFSKGFEGVRAPVLREPLIGSEQIADQLTEPWAAASLTYSACWPMA